LFDAVVTVLFDVAPISPNAGAVRELMARNDPDSAALESAFASWKKDRSIKFGSATSTAAFLDLYIAVTSGKETSREQLEGSLEATLRPGFSQPYYWAPFILIGEWSK
jgi:CHAT domain-containing protein